MEYQAIALKYRPKNFDQVVGQEQSVLALKNAISSGRIHHAYLFSGPRGVGKTSLARIFAKSLNCHNFAGLFIAEPFFDDLFSFFVFFMWPHSLP